MLHLRISGGILCNMFGKLDRWQLLIIILCSSLLSAGIIGLALSNRDGESSDESVFTSVQQYLDDEEENDIIQTPPPDAISEAEVRTISMELLPEMGEPTAYEYEDGEWEAKYEDGTEVKLDAMTGELIEIEEPGDSDD